MKTISFLSVLMLISISLFSQNNNFITKSFFSTNDTVYLPDGSGASYTSTILVEGFITGQTIMSPVELISVCAILEHSYLGDLEIMLECPTGQTVLLEDQGGGGTYLGIPLDYDPSPPGVGWEYCWDQSPQYGTMAAEGNNYSTLPSGTYTSFQSLSNFIGCPFNGIWTLTVTDNWSIDDGYIFGWDLNFVSDTGNNTMLTGQIYSDLNSDCIKDPSDLPLVNSFVELLPGPYYALTDSNGVYKFWVDTGTYYISQTLPNNLWGQNCPTSNHFINVISNNIDTLSGYDFANIPTIYCPMLSVDIATQVIRPCFNSTFYVEYENTGTIPAIGATIDVEIDPNMSYVSGGNLISQNGNVLTFDIGDVGINTSGSFSFDVYISCNQSLLGSTMCVDAHIFPDSLCFPTDSTWDKSSVSVEGYCNNDSLACFVILNTGSSVNGNMQGTSEYRIYENNILVYTGTFQLTGGDSVVICWPANGNTIRLEADQRPGHPGNSHPQDNVEMCGDNSNYVLGQILLIPEDDNDIFVDIECLEAVGSYDPNDKSVVPAGVTTYNYIEAEDILEYKINFQNTGTFYAQNIIIVDTISPLLDITSFESGVSSHNYYIELHASNIIHFIFPNIMLPDSGMNESGSHGFVKYKIGQIHGNPIGSVIENAAAIYFDFNTAIVTNTIFNTIGKRDDLVLKVISNETNELEINIYPNPTTGKINIVANEIEKVEVVNIEGRQVYKGKENIIDISKQAKGIYIIKITSKNGVAIEKVVLE